MSQFFNQYNAILEKSLQKVRLKVDPSNKCAEDFAQFDGYVGYILAETDDSIEFFYDNQTVTLPKDAVVVEGWKDTLKSMAGGAYRGLSNLTSAAGTGAANFIRGAAGQNTGSSWMGALGSMASGAAKGLGKAALALHGIDPRMLSSQQQAATSSQSKPIANLDKSKAFDIKNSNGFASIDINGVKYGIVAGSIKNQSNQVLLNSFTFDNIINKFFAENTLYQEYNNYYTSNPFANRVSTTAQPATAPAATPTATTPTATTQSQPQSGQAAAAVQYVPIGKITAPNLKQQNALKVPLTLELLPLDVKSSNITTPTLYQVMFTLAPNGQEVLLNFL